jgi:flagellar motor switch/type III secretory pathway protein FliN
VPAASQGFALRAFLGRSELQERLKDNPLTPGVLNVRIAGREGRIRLYLPGWEAGDLAAAAGLAPPVVSAADLQTAVTLRLALPPGSIPSGEVERLQSGDLLLLGATELPNLPECRLVTTTGWSLASATIVRHTPTVLTVRCGAYEPQVWDPAAAAVDTGQQVLTPVVGRLPIRIGQLQRWRSGAALDLPQDLATPVELHVDGRSVAGAELVRVDGEVGLRLLDRKDPGAPAARR